MPKNVKKLTLQKYMLACSFVWVRVFYINGREYTVVKNEVLKIIYGPKWEEVMGGLWKLHNEFFIICTLTVHH
jgi:hypothetical protein